MSWKHSKPQLPGGSLLLLLEITPWQSAFRVSDYLVKSHRKINFSLDLREKYHPCFFPHWHNHLCSLQLSTPLFKVALLRLYLSEAIVELWGPTHCFVKHWLSLCPQMPDFSINDSSNVDIKILLKYITAQSILYDIKIMFFHKDQFSYNILLCRNLSQVSPVMNLKLICAHTHGRS